MARKRQLRDFVYLDWERVRSLAAQLFSGIPEGLTLERGRQVETEGAIEGNIPLLLKGQAGVDYRFFRSENETRSFHHHVYTLVEEELLNEGNVTAIDGDFPFDEWTNGFFRDGQFVRVTGLIRLVDYAWVSAMMEALPKLMRAAYHGEELGLKRMKEAGLVSDKDLEARRREQARQLQELKDLKIDQITGLVRQLYGNVVRVKVLPSRHHPDKVLVGVGEVDNFHDTAASLSQKYGYEVDANWVVLGQVNVPGAIDVPIPIPTGNEIEDALEQTALSANQLIRTASGVRFPAVSVTPISIYRVL